MKRKKIFTLKGITVVLILIFLFTVGITHGECQEVFVKLNAVKTAKPVGETIMPKATVSDVKSSKDLKDRTVRIVIKTPDYSSIYHKNIVLSSSGLSVYSGKNFSTKKSCNNFSVSVSNRMFQKCNVIKVDSDKLIEWKNHSVNGEYSPYKGTLYIYKTEKGLVVVNQLDLEDYVAAVISSEIGEDSPLEALKAQAVCARTYILKRKREKYKKYDAVADDSTDFQVYNRICPGDNCKRAAKETKNVVMTYKGKPINAYYFSTSCGFTTDSKIWGKDNMPYLAGGVFIDKAVHVEDNKEFKKFIQSVPSGSEKEYPYYRWKVYMSKEQIENGIYRNLGVSCGKINRIEVNSRGKGGIVSNITIYGKNQQIVIKNQNEIRKAICSPYAKVKLNNGEIRTGCTMLPSAFFHIEGVYKNKELTGFNIYGGGFGHGSGMSQNGAKKMAETGKEYREILTKYYAGVKIDVY